MQILRSLHPVPDCFTDNAVVSSIDTGNIDQADDLFENLNDRFHDLMPPVQLELREKMRKMRDDGDPQAAIQNPNRPFAAQNYNEF